jgi:uncharacterized protein YdiU (UPF0061 family)
VYSSIDTGGRYAYGNQPRVAEWNLARLAEALLPLISDDGEQAVSLAVASLGAFRPQYNDAWSAGMRAKLGLPEGFDGEVVSALSEDLLSLLRAGAVDYTSFFRALAATARGDADAARNLFLDLAGFDAWLLRWRAAGPDPDAMDRVNAVYIPRNHLVEEALAAATDGDGEPLDRLLQAVTRPFEERSGLERYAGPAPETFGAYTTFCGT